MESQNKYAAIALKALQREPQRLPRMQEKTITRFQYGEMATLNTRSLELLPNQRLHQTPER